MCAVRIRNASERINATDERADKKNINESDKAGVLFGAVVGEESADGPDDGEDGDDEEDEDRIWCECVVLDVDVHEVGEHAHGWDLEVVRPSGGWRIDRRLTRVRISRKRQKTKSTPYIIFAVVEVV